jgi:hypothetical protein
MGKTKELNELEGYLKKVYRPVTPNPDFVSGLRAKLVSLPEKKRLTPRVFKYFLLGAAGVFSSVILIVTGVRATITILGTVSLLRQIRNQNNTASVQTPV